MLYVLRTPFEFCVRKSILGGNLVGIKLAG